MAFQVTFVQLVITSNHSKTKATTVEVNARQIGVKAEAYNATGMQQNMAMCKRTYYAVFLISPSQPEIRQQY